MISRLSLCDGGEWSDAGAAICTKCVAGKYLTLFTIAKASNNIPFWRRDYNMHKAGNHTGINQCGICPSGKYALEGSNKCESCEAGKFIDDNAADASKHVNAASCKTCAKGKESQAR